MALELRHMGLFRGARRGPRLGGDAIREHLSGALGEADAFPFEFHGMQVLAFFADAPFPHILYCTFGLSHVNSSQKVAGTQTELTMRVPHASLPPSWPAEHLARMAARMRRTGNDIAPGHYITMRDADIPAYVFVTDPVLGVLDAPTGLVRFTYAVGLAGDDVERMLQWDPVRFAGAVGEVQPLGVTDPQRPPVSAYPAVRQRVEEAVAAEGSSISAMLAETLVVEPGGVRVDREAARDIVRGARHRLLHGRTFALVSGDSWLMFDPDASATEFGQSHVVVPAEPRVAHEILAVFDDAPGEYALTTAPLSITVI